MNTSEKGSFQRESREKPFDPIGAKEEIRQALKDNLGELRSKFKENDPAFHSPLELVFQASLEDGLAFAKELRLSPDEVQNLVANGWFTETHPEVVKESVRVAKQMGIPKEDLLWWMHGTDRSYIDPLIEDALSDTLKRRDQKREKEYSPEMRELTDKLETYYREFLPYRLESGNSRNRDGSFQEEKLSKRELFERKKAEHIRRGETIIFDKYARGISEYLPNSNTTRVSEDDTVKLAELGIPEDEHAAVKRLAWDYQGKEILVKDEAERMRASGAKAGDEVFPVIAFNANGVKREFNLARDRKPVAKIIEQILKKEIVNDAQKIINESGTSGGYVVEKDPVTGKYVALHEAESYKRHEIEEEKMKFKPAFEATSDFLSRMKPPASDSLKDIGTWFESNIFQSPEWEEFQKNIDWPAEYKIPLPGLLDLSSKLSNPYLKKHFENYQLRTSIDEKKLRGIPQILLDMMEGKRPTSLSPEEIGAIYAYYEDHANCKDISGLPENKRVEADRIIGLANTMENPTMENLAKYFSPKSDEERNKDADAAKKSLKQWVSERLKSIDFIRKAMSEKVTDLLRTISAKSDANPRLLAEKLLKACYPREWSEYETTQQRSRSRSEFAGTFSGGRGSEFSEEGLTQDHFESSLAGGNFGGKEFQEGAPKKLATFDSPVHGMFVTNILGYDPVAGTWKRNHIPVDGDMEQARSMKKVTAKLDSKIGRIVPAPLASRNFEYHGGSKSELSKDSLGLIHLEGSREISGWSYEIPSGTVVPGAVEESTYTRFLSRFVNEGGAGYLEKNPDLPVECKMFVESIKTLSPRERVIKIQEFVTSRSFYDAWDNPIREKMNSAPFADRCELMKERLEMLRDELGDQVPSSAMFAGVCADFAMVTESMFREAGIASAVIEGYNMNGTEMTSHNAHGKSGVFWPDANGKTILAEIETTPAALTDAQRGAYEMQGIAPEPLTEEIQKAHLEEEKQAEEIAEEIKNLEGTLENKLAEIERAASDGKMLSLEDRKRLEEQTLALRTKIAEYIQQTATLKDISVLKGVLDAIRYSPVMKMDQNDIEAKVSSMKFIQGEYGRLEKEYENKEQPLERVSHLGKNFIGDLDAMIYNSHASGEDAAFIGYVGQVGEFGARKIPENHARIWAMLKTYMRAKLI